VLVTLRAADMNIPVGFLYDRPLAIDPVTSDAEWVIPRSDLVDETVIARAHGTGKKVAVWTVNYAEQMGQLARWDVDAIISDETELLVRMVDGV
jgi:glycerophosphoryl diester phosphodiesterase